MVVASLFPVPAKYFDSVFIWGLVSGLRETKTQELERIQHRMGAPERERISTGQNKAVSTYLCRAQRYRDSFLIKSVSGQASLLAINRSKATERNKSKLRLIDGEEPVKAVRLSNINVQIKFRF